MKEIQAKISQQLQQLQMLMHRVSFHYFMGDGRTYNPYRGQGRILAILKMKPEISQKELTYLLDMSKQSLAELLVKLEKNGYITRNPSEDDKRVMTIKLTEEGRKAADEVDDNTFEMTKIFDCLNDEELARFSEYLGRIIKRYEEQFPDEDFEQRHKTMEKFMSFHRRGFCGHGGHGNDFFRGGHGPHKDWSGC